MTVGDLLAEAEVIEALVLFLRARLDEAEGWAYDARHDYYHDDCGRRLSTDIQVKRRILDLVTYASGGDGYTEAYRDVVRLLGMEYAEHPDYREEWRP
ncbi:DUF6221 family protein [Amycolatopsis sp. NPDC051128]|uniref:DUF6221 family protein n=1 Tax=Amycolatopsis sp. NPDC051128 TaxID=3155412 RepID=UPI003449A4C3